MSVPLAGARSLKLLDQAKRLGTVAEAAVELKRTLVGRPDVEAQDRESMLACPRFARLHQGLTDAPAPRAADDGQIGDVPAFDSRHVRADLQQENPSGVPSSPSAIKTVARSS